MSQIKSGAVLAYISIFLTNIIGLIYTPYMLRVMGQSEYGLYSLVAAVVSYLSILDLGFGNAIIRYTSKFRAEGKHGELKSLFGMFMIVYFVIGLITLVIGSILCFNVESIFSESMTQTELGKAKIMMVLLVFNLAFTFPLSVFSAIITAYENFVFQRMVNLIRIVLNPIAMVIMLMIGYRAVGMVVIITVFNIVTMLINWWYCHKKLKIKISYNNIDWSLLREIAGFSFYVFLGIVMDKIYWSTGQFVLGIYAGTAAVAVFSIAIQMKIYYQSFSNAISGLFLPKVSAMVANLSSSKEISDLFIKTGRIQFLILGYILGGFLLFGRVFINLWAGKDYDQAYYMTLILIVPLSVPLIQNLGITILQAKNQQKFRSVLYIFIALASLAASIILAKKYGGIGCAIGTSVALIIGQCIIMNIYYYKRIQIDIPKFWKHIFKLSIPMIATILFCFAINYYFSSPGIISLVTKASIYSVIFMVSIWRFGMNGSEKYIILSLISKVFPKMQLN